MGRLRGERRKYGSTSEVRRCMRRDAVGMGVGRGGVVARPHAAAFRPLNLSHLCTTQNGVGSASRGPRNSPPSTHLPSGLASAKAHVPRGCCLCVCSIHNHPYLPLPTPVNKETLQKTGRGPLPPLVQVYLLFRDIFFSSRPSHVY